jgi:hypothetical protein
MESIDKGTVFSFAVGIAAFSPLASPVPKIKMRVASVGKTRMTFWHPGAYS